MYPPGWPGVVPPSIDSAAVKAEALLKSRLGAEWPLFQQTGRIVRTSKRWPAIDYYVERNEKVKVIKSGALLTTLCVTSTRSEPEADRLMTILDLIETDERRLWQMANAKSIVPQIPRSEALRILG